MPTIVGTYIVENSVCVCVICTKIRIYVVAVIEYSIISLENFSEFLITRRLISWKSLNSLTSYSHCSLQRIIFY